jgi:CheY-like chemotaxis protein
VDDDAESLDLYCHLIRERSKATVVTSRYPTAALRLARDHFFDVILIDVTMNYQGTPFGGLELYKSLLSRYGSSSLLAYSQFITDDLLRQYEYNFNFCEKGTNLIEFIERVIAEAEKLRSNQSCFVAMPFSRDYDELFRSIARSVAPSYVCIRVDQVVFNKSIVEKIFKEIRDAKLIVFLSTDRNPNAFYECGFATALGKEIVTLTDKHANLPFDIRDRTALAYGDDFGTLEEALASRLRDMTVVPPL